MYPFGGIKKRDWSEMKPLQIVYIISIVLLSRFKANGSPELIFETHYVFDPPPPPYFPPRPEPLELMVDVTNQLGNLITLTTFNE